MTFVKEIQKLNAGTVRYALAEDNLNASVRFCVSQMFLIFREKD